MGIGKLPLDKKEVIFRTSVIWREEGEFFDPLTQSYPTISFVSIAGQKNYGYIIYIIIL